MHGESRQGQDPLRPASSQGCRTPTRTPESGEMKILIACECSGRVRDAFIKMGHNAWSCDLQPSESPGPHIMRDVLQVLDGGWEMMIGHPVCRYLANSGVCWLRKIPGRCQAMRDGAEFFKKLLNANIPRIAIENPIQHKYARKIIGERQTQVIQPWMFGHPEQKATCLWLKNLPELIPTKNVYNEMMLLPDNLRQRLHYLPPSRERERERGAAHSKALRTQWLNSGEI